MRIRAEGCNIILAGFWNRLIFTPEWVVQHVFHGADFETYVALLPIYPIVFSSATVAMEVSLARLLFRAKRPSDENALSRLGEMARAVLTALPETPVQAVGINFSYVEDFPTGHIAAIFNDPDQPDLGKVGWSIGERKLARRLTREGQVLNLTMTHDGRTVVFDLNFHTEATSNPVALQAVQKGRVEDLNRQGLTLLRDTYQLVLEEEDDGDNA